MSEHRSPRPWHLACCQAGKGGLVADDAGSSIRAQRVVGDTSDELFGGNSAASAT